MKVFILTTYEYNTYSYSGLTECDQYVFDTLESAESYAADNDLIIREYAERDNHATIECVTVRTYVKGMGFI